MCKAFAVASDGYYYTLVTYLYKSESDAHNSYIWPGEGGPFFTVDGYGHPLIQIFMHQAGISGYPEGGC